MAGIDYAKLYPNTRIEGFEEVMNNLNKEIIAIEQRTVKGLVKSLAYIRNDTEKTPYITPLDYGNLSSSWFIVTASSVQPTDRFSTGFKNNPERKISVSTFTGWHSSTIAEAQTIVKEKSQGKTKFVMGGYSANYALWVHENMEAKNWSRPLSGPKWLEASFKRSTPKILEIIKENAAVK
jgi:hypothetical protein